MKRSRVYGNDDDRPIVVIVDEMNPMSRLRRTIEIDQCEEIRYGCSRDCLRSLVASQRCGRAVLKGDVTREELDAEMDRDCVTLVCHPNAPEEVRDVCCHMVHAIASWPRLMLGMAGHLEGRNTEWESGPVHCVIEFISKPSPRSFVERPLSTLIHALVCWLMEATNDNGTLDFAEVCTRVSRKAVTDMLRLDPFWHVRFDDDQRSSRRASAMSTALLAGRDANDEWSLAVTSAIERFHTRSMDVVRLFTMGVTLPTELLQAEFSRHRIRFSAKPSHYGSIPLVFPTGWVDARHKSRHSFAFLLERF